MQAEAKGWTDQELAGLLGRVPLFRGLPEAELRSIASLARSRALDRHEMLMREGDPADRLYIVYAGALEVLKERPRGEHERLALRRAGEAIGEMSLLQEAPSTASVRALEASSLVSISRDDFRKLLGASPVALGLLRSLALSLRSGHAAFSGQVAGTTHVDSLLQFSRVVQHGLLPRNLPQVPGFDVAVGVARDEQTKGLSLWDVQPYGERDALFSLLDVKGSGLPPGHLLALARALLRQLADGPVAGIGSIMEELNEAMADNLFAGLDECVNVGLVHLQPNGMPQICLAGGQPAFLIRDSGDIGELPAQGPALGILPHFDFGEQRLLMDRGDTLLVLSEMDVGLRRGASALAVERRNEGAAALASHLQRAMLRARGMRDSEQDIAVMVVKKVDADPARSGTSWALGQQVRPGTGAAFAG